MKVLFISDNNALNASFGAEQRGNILLHALLANGCQVDFSYIGTKEETYRPNIENLRVVFWSSERKWNISKMAERLRLATYRMFPTSEKLESVIDKLENENHYDYIVCRYIQFAALAGLYKYAHKLILDVDDLPAQSFLTNIGKSSFPKNIYHKMIYRSMDNETKRWIKKSNISLFPNEMQAIEYGGTFLPNIPVVSSDHPMFTPRCKNILFIGRMDFAPNYLGVDSFITHCWDNIVKAVPDAQFLIAGKGLSDEYIRSWECHPNVKVLGFVDSILDFYAKGNIVISPITMGAGTNIKVIEALSLGKACVLSKFSTKGFEKIIEHEKNCLVYNNDEVCSEYIINLLSDNGLAMSLGEESYKAANQFYSQNGINQIISEALSSNKLML